jgi:hypothetical protein
MSRTVLYVGHCVDPSPPYATTPLLRVLIERIGRAGSAVRASAVVGQSGLPGLLPDHQLGAVGDSLRCMSAAGDQSNSVSGPVLLIVLLAGGTIYLFGYLRAVMHRANKDYKSTKAAVKPLRKNFWAAWYAALRTGALVAIGLMLLVAWLIRDTRTVDGSEPPVPSPSASTPKKGR